MAAPAPAATPRHEPQPAPVTHVTIPAALANALANALADYLRLVELTHKAQEAAFLYEALLERGAVLGAHRVELRPATGSADIVALQVQS